jgi:hypothetical protein
LGRLLFLLVLRLGRRVPLQVHVSFHGLYLGREGNVRTPAASLGAVVRQVVQSFEEQGMSCRRYCSRTIFCTLPLFVERTKTLLEILEERGSEPRERLREVIFVVLWELVGRGGVEI